MLWGRRQSTVRECQKPSCLSARSMPQRLVTLKFFILTKFGVFHDYFDINRQGVSTQSLACRTVLSLSRPCGLFSHTTCCSDWVFWACWAILRILRQYVSDQPLGCDVRSRGSHSLDLLRPFKATKGPDSSTSLVRNARQCMSALTCTCAHSTLLTGIRGMSAVRFRRVGCWFGYTPQGVSDQPSDL